MKGEYISSETRNSNSQKYVVIIRGLPVEQFTSRRDAELYIERVHDFPEYYIIKGRYQKLKK